MECPTNMLLKPHDYQLKGANQIDHLCEGIFRGAIVGDQMGLGKTLTSVLVIRKRRDEPGMDLVVAPASVCEHWKETMERVFELVSSAT